MKEIGGYIELEIPEGSSFHENAIAINSGRNGIKYAIRAYKIQKLHVPYYTCPVVWQAIKEEGCDIEFYKINDKLLPDKDFDINDYVLYTNYFGVCSENIKKLEKKYKNLIIDNAQSFYMQPKGIASVYSPRKFFGVSDGGYVYCKKQLNNSFKQDFSYNRFSHLLKRLEAGSDFGYKDFQKNDDSLIGEDIKYMSNLTSKLLNSINYELAKQKRLENFKYLETNLKDINLYKFQITDDVPMYYPFLLENDKLRMKFIENKIYIAMCWKNLDNIVPQNSKELYLQKYLFPLIIDQRYGKAEMDRIIDIIKRNL